MAITPVFVKDEQVNTTFTVDLSSELGVGELPLSATFLASSPSLPAIIATVGVVSATGFQFLCSGGADNTSYGIKFSVTTNLPRTILVTAAVQVLTNINVPYYSSNPDGFSDLVDELLPGEAAIGKPLFVLPAGSVVTNGYILWEILDRQGRVFSYGNCYSFQLTVDTFSVIARGEAIVNLPSSAPPNLDSGGYQLRWALHQDNASVQYSYETIRVPERETVPIGVQDVIELQGSNCTIQIVTPRLHTNVAFEVYNGNSLVVALTPVASPVRVSSGWLYQAALTTSSLAGSLDPYQVTWKYWNSSAPNQAYRESARLFILTPSMMNALEDCRTQVMKARTTLMGFDDAIFDPATIVSWLRRGKDQFNAAAGVLTTFTMTDATGAIRELWLRCSEIAMLRSQSLAEGEKAFDFQGQAISLNVDKTQYYDKLADALQSAVDADLPPLKKNLKMSGVTGGTGNLNNGIGGYRAKVGIAVTPASPYLRPYFR
jgi:hypothetical protein